MEDWTPDPLVPPETVFEEAENEKRPVIVGYVSRNLHRQNSGRILTSP